MDIKLESPYRKHLAFSNEEHFKLSSTYNFEQVYGGLKDGSLRAHSLSTDRSNCIESINKVFDELAQQSTVERETLFLSDLRKQTLKLLNEDMDVFGRRTAVVTSPSTKSNGNEHFLKFNEQKFLQDKISVEVVAEINGAISGLVAKFRKNAKNGKTKREELTQNTGLIVRRVASLVNSEFKRKGILDVLHEYMGVNMCVTGLGIELSVPGANWWKVDYSVYEKAPKTLYYHFDESLAYPKAIVYLNDVSETNGATSCSPSFIKNSEITNLQFLIGRSIALVGRDDNPQLKSYYNHKYHQTFGCPLFRQDFSKLPNELKFSSHFGWDVIPDSPLESFLLKDERKIVGKAGTFIAFDGGLLPHRGGMILEGDRVALQVVFGEKLPLLKKVQKKLKQLISQARH